MVEWLERLGYGAGGHEIESLFGSVHDWKTLSVNPSVNTYFFRIREG